MAKTSRNDRVSIALPTGVLLQGALKLLARARLARLSAPELGRKLLVERPGLRVVLVRPSDVPAYVDHGAVRFGPERTRVEAPALVVFGEGDVVEASAEPGGGRFLLAAARPLGEPIARYGPFVMNTRAEIEQTLHELRTGRFIREEPRE